MDYPKDNTAETFGDDVAGNLNAATIDDMGYAFGGDHLNHRHNHAMSRVAQYIEAAERDNTRPPCVRIVVAPI